eukprot:8589374-Alexandrium_andersonii.AAC.1
MTVGAPPPVRNLRGLGVARGILGARETQENAQYLILQARRAVRVLAFTWDRQDLTAALVHVCTKDVPVRIGVDRKQTLAGNTKEQTARLQELAAAGAE